MKKLLLILLLLCLSSKASAQNKGVLLENLTWQVGRVMERAEKVKVKESRKNKPGPRAAQVAR